MKVLVIQTAFIGDAILASSMLEALRAHKDIAEVSLLVRKGNHSLYKGHPFIKNLHILDKSLAKWKQILGMVKEIRKEKYDAVINIQRFMATGIITSLSGAKVTIGFDKNPLSRLFSHAIPHQIGDGRHETERNMDLLEPLIGACSALPKLYPSAKDIETVTRGKAYVCLAPSSVWYTKQWPEENWTRLINRFPEEVDILLLGGPGDQEQCKRIKKNSGVKRVENLAGKLTLLQSASLMKRAQMNYVNDSGPLHLCSSMNAPVTVFFCSTIPSFGFGPLSERSHIIETNEDLDCRPCGLHGLKACPKGHYKCAKMDMAAIPIPAGV